MSIPTIKVHFIGKDEQKASFDAPIGLSLLEVAHKHAVEIEGACGGALACSTCHVIVDDSFFDQIEEASSEEEDMLDLAFGLTRTSRLSCQIILTKELDGLTVRLPNATRNVLLN